MDAWGAPKRVFPTHFTDQIDHFPRNSRKALRCQAMTVSGFTIIRTERQSAQTRDNHTQRIRSTAVSFGRFPADLLRTPIWWRSARFSKCRAARVFNSEHSMAINAERMVWNGRGSRRRIRNTHDLREFGVYDRHSQLNSAGRGLLMQYSAGY